MLGLFVSLANQRTTRMAFKNAAIRIGSGKDCDLSLQDGDVSIHHCVLQVLPGTPGVPPRWHVAVADAPVLLDNRPLPSGTTHVPDGSRLVIGQYTVELACDEPNVSTDPVESELLLAIASGDRASREIYADWLEERGMHSKAEYIRLQDQLHAASTDPTSLRGAFVARSQRLRDLAVRFSAAWRRQLARPIIEKCDVGFELECPIEWGSLPAGEDPRVRSCEVCKKQVHYCATIDEARDHAWNGKCVVVDLVAIRRPRDLDPAPRPMMMGRVMPMRGPGDE